ncbi:10353_t:CDS:2 [Funneliformis geosporum]|nr:10353_t:CDS:2 [Funneliformis geosporum]
MIVGTILDLVSIWMKVEKDSIPKEDIKIDLEDNNILKISGERKEEKKVEEEKSHYSEVFFGSFTRQFKLPATVDKEKDIKACYESGVLSISIPKTSSERIKQIKVE